MFSARDLGVNVLGRGYCAEPSVLQCQHSYCQIPSCQLYTLGCFEYTRYLGRCKSPTEYCQDPTPCPHQTVWFCRGNTIPWCKDATPPELCHGSSCMGSSRIRVDPTAFPDLADLRQELRDSLNQVEKLQNKVERAVDQEVRDHVRQKIDSLRSAEDAKAYGDWLGKEASRCAGRIKDLEKG